MAICTMLSVIPNEVRNLSWQLKFSVMYKKDFSRRCLKVEAKHLLTSQILQHSITPVLQHSKPFRSHIEENSFVFSLKPDVEAVNRFVHSPFRATRSKSDGVFCS